MDDRRPDDTQIWDIRREIDALDKVREEILKLFESQEDNSMDSIWKVDLRDLYFSVVSSWQLLKSCPSLEGTERNQRADNAKQFLRVAEEKFQQVLSEVETVQNNRSLKIQEDLKEVFQKVIESLHQAIQVYLPEKKSSPPEKTIVKTGPMEFHLLCAVCGELAVSFTLGPIADDGSGKINYKGITKSTTLDFQLNSSIFDLLDEGNIREVHNHLEKNTFIEDGIDAYCPKCDKIYCKNHYLTRVVYDQGFYDCTYGTCPIGHERIIDD
ncbi:MAG: hypothetical protein GF411_02400 [Candidatus Lokiarchaeota archaeon]|nr:hypothetical protein [Candidatus Lokiarchaeota archaeon]